MPDFLWSATRHFFAHYVLFFIVLGASFEFLIRKCSARYTAAPLIASAVLLLWIIGGCLLRVDQIHDMNINYPWRDYAYLTKRQNYAFPTGGWWMRNGNQTEMFEVGQEQLIPESGAGRFGSNGSLGSHALCAFLLVQSAQDVRFLDKGQKVKVRDLTGVAVETGEVISTSNDGHLAFVIFPQCVEAFGSFEIEGLRGKSLRWNPVIR